MSIAGSALFLVASLVALLAAIATVTYRNPIRAAMGLLVHILALAGLYLSLHAHLLAALQLIVYAGAVVVLFIFVIMLIGPTPLPEHDTKGVMSKTLSVCLMAVITAVLAFSLVEHRPSKPAIEICQRGQQDCAQFGGVDGLSQELYVKGVVPFELISVLLLVAIIGAIGVARGRSSMERKAVMDKERQLPAGASPHGGQ